VLGPVIGPCCYEFGPDDLHRVADGVGVHVDVITARTGEGHLALDVPGAVAAGLRSVGVDVDTVFTTLGGCTGCTYPGFSHRVRRDAERHVMAVWRPSGAHA
jgi:copper oxidase (laccase) domain-containing protein